MPYEVTFINENDRVKAHSLVSPTVRLFDTKVSQSVKDIDSFTFSILRNHPAYGFIQEMKTLVEITDLDTGLVEFEGRVTNQTGKPRTQSQSLNMYLKMLLGYCMIQDKCNTILKGLRQIYLDS